MRLFALALVLAASSAAAQPADTLRATLDLRGPIAAGWLDPATETVGLRGGLAPLSWDATTPADDPDGDGLYHVAVPFALVGDSARVELKVKVDGAGNPNGGWQDGPNRAVTVRRGVGADLALVWDDRPAAPPPSVVGTVERIRAVGGAGLAPRDVFVYLPPGYAEADRRYPVLYLHDGENAFGAVAGGRDWQMDEAAEALVAAGEIEPVVIVAVSSTDVRQDEYTPTVQTWRHELVRTAPPTSHGLLGAATGVFEAEDGGAVTVRLDGDGLVVEDSDAPGPQRLVALGDGRFSVSDTGITVAFERDAAGAVDRVVATRPPTGGRGDAYGAFLVDVVKPLVDGRYRTLPDAAHTGLGGVSLGGLVTVHLGLTRPDVFGRLLVASPSVWWDDRSILESVAATPPEQPAGRGGQRVWVDIGTAEGGSMVADARALADALRGAGWSDVRYVEAPDAGHDWDAWAARAPDALRFLFPPE